MKAVIGITVLAGAGTGGYFAYEHFSKNNTKKSSTKFELDQLPSATDVEAFEKFEKDYNRKYVSEEARLRAFEIFVDNVKLINTHNARNLKSTLGINEFADMHHDEFKAKLGLRLAKPNTLFKTNLGTFEATPGFKAPDSMDWRDKGAVTPVKNQAQCGSCWAFSTTGGLEGRNFVATGTLCSMSEQQFVDCDKGTDQGCEGGLMDSAFEFAESHSICSEDSYSYKGVDESCPADLESTCDVCIKKGDVTGFKDVKSNDVDAMVQAISEGPVSVAIEADQSVFQFYKSGVVTSEECGENLDHGVLAIGYGTDDDGTEYWLVKNSWGETWGDQGFVKIAKALNSDGESECGILSQPSYPEIATQQKAAVQATQSAMSMAKPMEKLFI